MAVLKDHPVAVKAAGFFCDEILYFMRFNPCSTNAKLVAVPMPDGDIAITAVRTTPNRRTTKTTVKSPAVSVITLTVNTERDLVELRFPGKPDDATRAEMKAAKFRWYGPAGCWYHKNTPENFAWAQAFVSRHTSSGAVVAPATPPPLPEELEEQRPARLDAITRPCKIVAHPTKADWFMLIEQGDAQNTIGETLRAAGSRSHCEKWLAAIQFAGTCIEFQQSIGRIATVAGKTTLEVYALWRKYSDTCQGSDQSALLGEFIEWHKPALGGDMTALRAALEPPVDVTPVVPQIAPMRGMTPLGIKPKSVGKVPTCVFCGRSGNGVQFVIFNPRFKPFGTACTDCEASLPEGTAVPASNVDSLPVVPDSIPTPLKSANPAAPLALLPAPVLVVPMVADRKVPAWRQRLAIKS